MKGKEDEQQAKKKQTQSQQYKKLLRLVAIVIKNLFITTCIQILLQATVQQLLPLIN